MVGDFQAESCNAFELLDYYVHVAHIYNNYNNSKLIKVFAVDSIAIIDIRGDLKVTNQTKPG